MGYKAFALSGRRGGVAIAPGCCPGLGASALSGRVGQAGKSRSFCPFRACGASVEMGLPDCFQDLKCGRIAAKKSIACKLR